MGLSNTATGGDGTHPGRMVALGIDTATGVCAVGLWAVGPAAGEGPPPGVPLAWRAEALARGQAERLLPLIQEVMSEAGVGFDAIDRYGVTVGPGAFTGLRVGLATARGLALASGRPLMGVTGLAALAHAAVHGLAGLAAPTGPIMVALDSRREDVYLQTFDAADAPTSPAEAVLPADLPARARSLPAPPLLLGDAASTVAGALQAAGCAFVLAPSAPAAAALAVARLAALATMEDFAGHPADPLYIRPPDVTVAGPLAP